MPNWAIYGRERARGPGPATPAGGGDSAAATNFLARAGSMNATHTNAYKDLLNGLTTDGFFDGSGNSSIFDWLYATCTETEAMSLLNLVKNSYNLTKTGIPTFTADQGWSNFSGNPNNLNMNYNPGDGGGPYNYQRDSAHVMVWAETITTGITSIGSSTAGGPPGSFIIPNFGGGGGNNLFMRLNSSTNLGAQTVQGPGMHTIVRTGASTMKWYHGNGTDLSGGQDASAAVLNQGWLFGADGGNASNTHGTGRLSFSSGGAQITQTQVQQIFSRVSAFRTAVGL